LPLVTRRAEGSSAIRKEAASWFYASAIQGYVPAMISLAEVQTYRLLKFLQEERQLIAAKQTLSKFKYQ
jgi:hypothetical protein